MGLTIPGMTALSTGADDLNARLLAQMDEFEKSQQTKFTEFFRFKAPSDNTIVRFLPSKGWPNDITWFRQFGRHGIKSATGGKAVMFGCVSHAFGQSCPVCDAQRTHKDSADAILAKIADGAYASKRYMVNGQIFDMATRAFGPVIPFELTKGQFDELKPVMRMVNPRFFDPEVGHILHLKVTPRVQGSGFDIKVMRAEGPHNSGITPDQLYDLDALVKKEYYEGGMKPVSAFTGNFMAPIAQAPGEAGTSGLTAIGAAPSVLGGGGLSALPAPAAAPILTTAVATAPAAAPAIDYAALAPQPAVQPAVAQPQPTAMPWDGQSQFAPGVTPSVASVTPTLAPAATTLAAAAIAQPVTVEAVAAQPAPVVAPPPAAPLAAAEVDDLEAKLMALVS